MSILTYFIFFDNHTCVRSIGNLVWCNTLRYAYYLAILAIRTAICTANGSAGLALQVALIIAKILLRY